MASKKAIILFGPTAAGKTGASLHLANALNGEIINADSRQIYREMPIITAMPSSEEQSQAPHHLFDFLDPTKAFSVGAWLKLAREKAEHIWQQNKIPIFVGGTGFYLKVLEAGISPMPETDLKILNNFKKQCEEEGVDKLYQDLKRVDPIWAAQTEPEDSHRVLRGLCVFKQTGRTLTSWQSEPPSGFLEANFVKLAISPSRDVLNDRIHRRYQLMIKEGVTHEAENLYSKYLKHLPENEVIPPAFKSIGLLNYAAYFSGNISEQEAHEKAEQQMRQYAKRQRTWLRNSFEPDFVYPSGHDSLIMSDAIKNTWNSSDNHTK